MLAEAPLQAAAASPSSIAPSGDMTAPSGDDLVHFPVLDLLEGFFSDPVITSAISDFANEHAHKIKPLAPGDEHPIFYHETYLAYTRMLEDKIEVFMADNEIELNDVLSAARSAPSGTHTFVDYVLASTEYRAFLELMDDFRHLSDWDVGEDADAGKPLEASAR
uniref:BART domain-containing protein n=1 Tax=Haptolina brevifila TaxID=156173 RepID=A0A7S2E212_9EUKA|mmetsp:Transcript_47292/g.94284  ORF Transcript_47292/g.94284 Transcript_47292/m.94284 type:complete len:164 (+) Transcript_47292:37-528(+)